MLSLRRRASPVASSPRPRPHPRPRQHPHSYARAPAILFVRAWLSASPFLTKKRFGLRTCHTVQEIYVGAGVPLLHFYFEFLNYFSVPCGSSSFFLLKTTSSHSPTQHPTHRLSNIGSVAARPEARRRGPWSSRYLISDPESLAEEAGMKNIAREILGEMRVPWLLCRHAHQF